MIKLIDILKEITGTLIGPFFHETDKDNVKDIMDKGMVNIYACSFNNVHKVI
jgi:hypothetical protein